MHYHTFCEEKFGHDIGENHAESLSLALYQQQNKKRDEKSLPKKLQRMVDTFQKTQKLANSMKFGK